MEQGMKDDLTCPVCLDIMEDPPIYVCENPKGHPLCAECHQSLKEAKKTCQAVCPVCRVPLADRRNLSQESLVEKLPGKITCKFQGCDFKRSNKEAVNKHEEESCEHRYVPCAYCHDEVGMKHIIDCACPRGP